jgi:CHAD domain-containing protein
MAPEIRLRAGREPRRPGLRSRMDRVLEELRRVGKSEDIEAVHRLRVAIRRCRSFAAVMEEVDAHHGWTEMRRLPRKLFRAFGRLRDLHVIEASVKRLISADDRTQAPLLGRLQDEAAMRYRQLRRVARQFDQTGWRRLARVLPTRARLVPPNSLTARCLVQQRYKEFRRLHARAMRTESPASWHALRVGLKRFRYAVETILPSRSVAWDAALGEMQDLLGTISDLDVLVSWIAEESECVDSAARASIRDVVARERRASIERYCQRVCGDDGLLGEWKAGLLDREAIGRAAAARLNTTARASDPRPHRTAVIRQLALVLFDGLAASGAESRFKDARLRRIFRAAAQLHGIDVNGRHTSRHKAARKFLQAAPPPPGWKPSEWVLLAEVVRYHRGTEPAAEHEQFTRLSPDGQDRVRGLAGVLRLARGLVRCGVSGADGARVDHTAAYVRLRVAGLQDTEHNAARLAAARHLLEVYLRRPILIEFAAAPESIGASRLTSSSARSLAAPSGAAGPAVRQFRRAGGNR